MAAIATSVAIGAAALQALARAVLEYLGEPVVEAYPSPKPPLANIDPNLQPKPTSTDDPLASGTAPRQSVEPPERKKNAGAKMKVPRIREA
ncbi:hypothetical protein PENFLA_c009G05197 [Penicillium flavigenum]|uniref:Uncharacterized protein n=1 Tax=Penicillium flavigenum TaxID=254877 RepID=A0A1V6TEU5_9EURO|nr:hypothetical protein PENFLA_c009G05197 [Penicillium flavigenum]